jgi:hypothetical protein
MLLSTNVFIYFRECSGTKQSFTCPFEKLVEIVGTAVTLMESNGPLAFSAASFSSCHYE